MKTAKIVLEDIKDPDGWNELIRDLGLVDNEGESTPANKKLIEKHFDFREYASVELVIDEGLNVVGGKILPK